MIRPSEEAGAMLLSVHIPKTAGVSFRLMLARLFGEGFVQHYWEITDARGRVLTEIPANATCVHGHFVADELAAQFPQAPLITWVRDPVERVVSSYFHRLRDPDWRHPVCVELHRQKLSVEKYAELDLVRNEMARFMGTKRPQDFAFIGLVEEIDVSMGRFFEQFDLPRVDVPRENVNPERRTNRYDLTESARARILELNAEDAAIYETCRNCWSAA
ncbi:MAG: sulfotransferase family 2 domain-containing protein [Verrucomicrobia bacterium]|nr:sulfotransferase family 2 domain-containing protein [Verrucomicrobiota bacterium]